VKTERPLATKLRAFRPRGLAWLVAVTGLVGCDHTTKHLAKGALENGPPLSVLGRVLELRYTENTDVAFQALRWVPASARGPLLLVLGLSSITLLAYFLLRLAVTRTVRLGLVLILAGALGNLGDRVFRGYVVDFIHVSHWPVFNVADVCVSVGAALLLWAHAVKGPDAGPRSA